MTWTHGKSLIALVAVLFAAGLFLAYDASRHTESRYDVSIALEVQSWDVPGLDGILRFVSEFTNFGPGVAIWMAVVVILIWRGLRVEALALMMAAVTFLGAETLGLLVDRPRPSPELVYVSESLVGKSFPSGHVFAAVVFYGLLVAMILRRTRLIFLRLLVPAIAISIVVLAGVARVELGVHWPTTYREAFFWVARSLADCSGFTPG